MSSATNHNYEYVQSTIVDNIVVPLILNTKEAISIVWFKRDLRLNDNEPLFLAQQSQLPVLLLYCFEPSVMQYDDSDVRHWRFVYESIIDLNQRLINFGTQIQVCHQEVIDVLDKLRHHYDIRHIFSHQETGNKVTYDRDLSVQKFCLEQNISWQESLTNGVVRKLKSRNNWEAIWKETMSKPIIKADLKNINFLSLHPSLKKDINDPEIGSILNHSHGWYGSEWRIEAVQRIKFWRGLTGNDKYDSERCLGRRETKPETALAEARL